MKYYTIDWDYEDLNVIGNYPQVTIKDGYNPSLPEGHWQVKPHHFPNFIPNLELELHKNANPTDLIEKHVNFGMMINQKFKNIIEKFKLPPHAFYPVKVYHKGEVLKYYWFHYIVDIWKYIDQKKSTIQVYKKFEFEIEDIIPISNIRNIEEFEKSLPRQKELRVNKIYFNNSFPNYDIIKVSKIGYFESIISESLLTLLESSGTTGFKAKLFDKIACN
ncbi:conserved hypothetical protein [Tenacibaculum sp. 190524A02b]|uniref:Uncharacterized protein n=1 Tax=Tenacibaculum vairaonense TaxID=3137860 RepID=A0ABM9PN49_9FLAO